LNVKVPPHPAERGDTAEIYSIVRLLGTIPLNVADFPLQLWKDESPDFALHLGDLSIGVEHTELFQKMQCSRPNCAPRKAA